MKNSTFFIQLGLIAIAVGIGITYIKPTLDSISVVQDQIQVYRNEINNVAQVNARLESLVAEVDSVSNTDQQALLRYLPNEINELVIMQDIQSILNGGQFRIQDISYESQVTASEEVEGIIPHKFLFSGQSDYVQLKAILRAFEQNDYLFEFQNLNITVGENGLLDVDAELLVYTRSTDS